MRKCVFALFERLNQDRNVFSLVSLPGLTRQSILLEKALFLMDARVKPGHDD
jgi:hypothetical protein